MTVSLAPFGLFSSEVSAVYENTRQQPESNTRAAWWFIFFCIACVAFTGVFLMAYVYWGFK